MMNHLSMLVQIWIDLFSRGWSYVQKILKRVVWKSGKGASEVPCTDVVLFTGGPAEDEVAAAHELDEIKRELAFVMSIVAAKLQTLVDESLMEEPMFTVYLAPELVSNWKSLGNPATDSLGKFEIDDRDLWTKNRIRNRRAKLLEKLIIQSDDIGSIVLFILQRYSYPPPNSPDS